MGNAGKIFIALKRDTRNSGSLAGAAFISWEMDVASISPCPLTSCPAMILDRSPHGASLRYVMQIALRLSVGVVAAALFAAEVRARALEQIGTIKVSQSPIGKTPMYIGYNMGHYLPG